MNIKLKNKTYGKFKVTDGVMKTVEENTHDETPPISEIFKKQKSYAAVFLNDDKDMLYSIPYLNKEKMIWGEMQLLPILYFNLCIDFYNISENILQTFFRRNDNDKNQMIELAPEYYNSINSYRISAIIFLHTAIDATINYIIPEDFTYYSKHREKILTKKEIEDLPFMVKMKEIFRSLFEFDICNEKIYNTITEINNHRTNLIHLNTTKDKLSTEKFFNEMSDALCTNLEPYIIATIELFKKFKPELFETFEIKNHVVTRGGKNGLISIYYPVVNTITKEDFISE